MKKILILLIILLLSLTILIVNNKKNTNNIIEPTDLNKNHVCACDSMIIINYNGPKAQIVWKNNTKSFFCEVREIFYEINDKIKKKQIKFIYVQDFTNLEWGSYTDKWIKAENAYYVIDSKKDGAMGVSYVPFSNIENAKDFKNKNGGIILNFEDITTDVLNKSNEILKNRMLF